MLVHGADINAGFTDSDLLRLVVRCAVDDATTLRRIRFLVARGAKAAGSGAMWEAVAADSAELSSCLLDSGADPDDVVDPGKNSLLMIAARKRLSGNGNTVSYSRCQYQSCLSSRKRCDSDCEEKRQ